MRVIENVEKLCAEPWRGVLGYRKLLVEAEVHVGVPGPRMVFLPEFPNVSVTGI